MLQDKKIEELSDSEYVFLTENLDEWSPDKTVKYLVYNRKNRLMQIVRQVIKTELTVQEQGLAMDYWYKGLSADVLKEKYKMSRSSVYRSIELIRDKLATFLKYVVSYDNTNPPSMEDFFDFLRREEKGEGFFEN